MVVRLGTEQDYEQVNIIRAEVNDIHVEGEPANFKPGFSDEKKEYLRTFFGSDTKKLFVCEERGEVCAYAMLELVVKPENVYRWEQRFIEVQELGTKESFRGKGMGRVLMEEIANYAREVGFPRVELNMWAFNDSALKFYEKMGFETYRRYMRLKV
ncbi:MAG: GNAT family N-acetyltransferase [Clostridiales bacterium]|nr:GNAT family N-acetyltransferase [Clostridiales bacterium]